KPDGAINNYTGILFDRGSSAVGIDIADNQPCYHWNDTQYNYRSGLQLTDGAWNMVAMVVTPTEATFYLGDAEGNLASAVNAVAHSPAKLTGAFSIGGDTVNSGRRFKGDIDEPAVFGYALSADQIESIYKKGMGGETPAGPVLSFEMTDLGLILTWEKGKLEIGATAEGPWIQIENASNEGYIYNGESGTAYFRLVE
ncbi:MAG: LamG domain-containing protein, partial [Verrucomicrobia bacterium]|nr:LamG domain-containing protein [Verrucomicrobiota bacterium]